MQCSRFLRMRVTAVVRATLPTSLRIANVGGYALKPSLQQTSSWPKKFVGALGCDLRAADSPTAISAEFADIAVEELPRRVQALLRSDTEDSLVYSINTALQEFASEGSEPLVDVYVNGVLRGCDLNDGVTRKLLSQESLTFELGDMTVISKPDHLLRCGATSDTVVDIVTQESKGAGPKGLAWGQIVGEMVAAALANDLEDFTSAPPPIFGIRVVGTRWTFLRADFTQEYLDRLSTYKLLPSDRFRVWVWGGPMAKLDDVRQSATAQWGLDYTNSEERQQLMRMIVALGREARKLVRGQEEVQAQSKVKA